MHAKAVEIAWHDNSAIWSVDISCANRVVTASGDKVARIWRFHDDPYKILSAHLSPSSSHNATPLSSKQQSSTNPVPNGNAAATFNSNTAPPLSSSTPVSSTVITPSAPSTTLTTVPPNPNPNSTPTPAQNRTLTPTTNPTTNPTPTNPTTSSFKSHGKLSKLASIKLDASLVDWLCDLRAHATTINIARFSPDGRTVATAADLGEIVLWRLDESAGAVEPSPLVPDDEQPKERWQRDTTLRGHVQDVLDLAWSADGRHLASASVDNTVMLWDIASTKKSTHRPQPIVLRNHNNFVQGVAIDPLYRLIASMGNDRAVRVFTADPNNSNLPVNQNNKNGTNNKWIQVATVSSSHDSRLFIDDSKFKTFFRRLHWSPDGSVLACPSGIHITHNNKNKSNSFNNNNNNKNSNNNSNSDMIPNSNMSVPNNINNMNINNSDAPRKFAVHIFARNRWNAPIIQCGNLPTPPSSVRFNPLLFKLRSSDKDKIQGPFKSFTYRMIFAVVCVHTILFYDTECLARPFATVEGLHCAEHTDLTWSANGRTCLVSSVDGYVSTICFAPDELGPVLPTSEVPSWLHCQEPVLEKFSSPFSQQLQHQKTNKTVTTPTTTIVTPVPSSAKQKLTTAVIVNTK